MTATVEALSSQNVCELMDVTYRQLDYLVRCLERESIELVPIDVGHGGRGDRRWDPEIVRRLQVAVALANTVPHTSQGSPLAQMARAALDTPVTPPERGWALWVRGAVIYPTTARQLGDMLRGCDAVVARIPEGPQ